MKILAIFCFLLVSGYLWAQPCTTAGQTPSTAFPVCGTSAFHQASVPLCASQPSLYVPGCNDGASYTDRNPFWYKFTCYQSGSLAFLIAPLNQGDDYDWQLYDITGHDPSDVYTDHSLVIAGNWAGTYGNTGASASGVPFIQCASIATDNKNSFAAMPNLVVSHTYLLMVSHYTNSQSGYDLSFGGGTAVITDTTPPHLKYVEVSCSADVIRVKLNKKMKCSTIAPDASDFFITPGNIPISSAVGINCSSGFDADSVELHLSSTLAPGTYTVNVKQGIDNNTILDFCDNAIPTSDIATFVVAPVVPTPMDSIAPLQCAAQSLHLIFKKNMLCSSVAADGSDFTITGTYPVTISGAYGNCSGGAAVSKEIIVTLSQPLYTSGNFRITLKTGLDGTTVVDECGQQTPGSFLNFSVKDTVNADFTYVKAYGCSVDTINCFHPGANGVNSWQWNLDNSQTSTQQNAQGLYSIFSNENIQLIVSNGFCTDTSSQIVVLDNYLKANFSSSGDVCPKEPTQFTNASQGHIAQYSWSFGDGGSSTQPSPSHIFTAPLVTSPYTVNLTVTDSFGCQSTASKPIKVYSSCYLAVPTAFTPNGDGKNDFLVPLNAIKAENLTFKVYNRWGQLIFETKDWKHGWDGTFGGLPQPSDVYVWLLTYTDRDSKEQRTMKGTAVLIR